MTDPRKSLPLKVGAFLLLCITLFVSVCSIGLTALLAVNNFFTSSEKNVTNEILSSELSRIGHIIAETYESSRSEKETLAVYDKVLSNFYFSLKNAEGDVLVSNYNGENYRVHDTVTVWTEDLVAKTNEGSEKTTYFEYEDGILKKYEITEEGSTSEPTLTEYSVTIYIKEEFVTSDRISNVVGAISIAYRWRFTVLAIGAVALLLSIVLFVFLIFAAGHRKGTDEVRLNSFDKMPFDVLFSVYTFIAWIELTFLSGKFGIGETVVMLCLFAAVDVPLGMLFVMSFAARIKTGTLFRNTVIFKILRLIWKLFKAVWTLFRNIPLVPKTAIALAALSIIEFLALAIFRDNIGNILTLWLILKFVEIPCFLYAAICAKKLISGTKEISGGNLGYKIDTSKMLLEMKEHGEDLNNIGNGISAAVEEKLKSERMKTELITNVSHDIKTPLTSIINYVDLLKKEQMENETAIKYLEVLDRQSARLKKLVEDLVEASKASTGNIEVRLEKCELSVMLEQTTGEYKERVEKAGADIVLTIPSESVIIQADGRLLWRVFDNLMNNICKYTQENTRVYLSLKKTGSKAVITFKNISKYPLSISPEELTERFVRGDGSRNTEGSGLGLSIAKSLVALQNGEMTVSTDADLFKVTLVFDMI